MRYNRKTILSTRCKRAQEGEYKAVLITDDVQKDVQPTNVFDVIWKSLKK
ncbi:hypothetical protein [Mucilaginibacter sp.]|nr:hypothetical protein [Mucilaginibacter sp.]